MKWKNIKHFLTPTCSTGHTSVLQSAMSEHLLHMEKFKLLLICNARAGDPFSLSNKMSIDTAPTAANLFYLVYFKTHIQALPNTSILVRDIIEDSGSRQE